MLQGIGVFLSLFVLCVGRSPRRYHHLNLTRASKSDLVAYRSSLTLDWLSDEDTRQRELADAFAADHGATQSVYSANCIAYPRPTATKIGKLIIELMRSLEGDQSKIVGDFVHSLVQSKILIENAIFEEELNFESLVRSSDMMRGEPHTTFPRVIALVWLTITDPGPNKKLGWCPIKRLNRYLLNSRPADVAQRFRTLDSMLSRIRFVVEEFIQSVTPLTVFTKKTSGPNRRVTRTKGKKLVAHVSSRSTGLDKLLARSKDYEIEDLMETEHNMEVASSEASRTKSYPLFTSLVIVLMFF